MGGDEVFCFIGDDVGDVLVFPESGLASGHPADAGDAVDYRIVMSLTGF